MHITLEGFTFTRIEQDVYDTLKKEFPCIYDIKFNLYSPVLITVIVLDKSALLDINELYKYMHDHAFTPFQILTFKEVNKDAETSEED